jgi:hypothetical protein
MDNRSGLLTCVLILLSLLSGLCASAVISTKAAEQPATHVAPTNSLTRRPLVQKPPQVQKPSELDQAVLITGLVEDQKPALYATADGGKTSPRGCGASSPAKRPNERI